MARFSGKIGFATDTETSPGVWQAVITERLYYGDVIRDTRRANDSGVVNDTISLNNRISVVADGYANENISAMKYVEWAGSRWEISSVEVQRPRLILSVGGVYNGQPPATPGAT